MQKVCIIVPCFNEENRLPIGEFEKHILFNTNTYFLFVNDGSSDGTQDLLEKICSVDNERCMTLRLEKNAGKAEAVRYGMNRAIIWDEFDYIGYFDADLATPLDQINYMIGYTGERSYHLIMGIRVARLGAQIERRSFRHIAGRVFATVISMMLKIPVYDSQCGAKVFSALVAEKIFNEKFTSKWLFDVEVLARTMQYLGTAKFNTTVIEIPLEKWFEKGSSKIKSTYFFRAPYDLCRIYFSSIRGKRRVVVHKDANAVLTG